MLAYLARLVLWCIGWKQPAPNTVKALTATPMLILVCRARSWRDTLLFLLYTWAYPEISSKMYVICPQSLHKLHSKSIFGFKLIQRECSITRGNELPDVVNNAIWLEKPKQFIVAYPERSYSDAQCDYSFKMAKSQYSAIAGAAFNYEYHSLVLSDIMMFKDYLRTSANLPVKLKLEKFFSGVTPYDPDDPKIHFVSTTAKVMVATIILWLFYSCFFA